VTSDAVACCVQASVDHGVAQWKQLLSMEMTLPLDPLQMPDTFIYLCNGPKPADRICYKRMKTAELLSGEFSAPALWHVLNEDRAINAVKDKERPGVYGVAVCCGVLLVEGITSHCAAYCRREQPSVNTRATRARRCC
jgi:hypothetical protein